MSCIIPSVGTPAQKYARNWTPSYRQKLVWKLKKFTGWVAEVTFGFRHSNITIPLNDHQTCLDCGATRLYLYNTEMFFQGITDAPIFIGRWKKAAIEPERLVARPPANHAVAKANGRAAILNPGAENALFHRRDPRAVQQ